MSSGNFEYTLEEQAALLGQFADVMEAARERQRPAQKISLALSAAISDDDIIRVPKVVQTSTGKIFHVSSGNNIRSATDAINTLDCKVKRGLAETPNKIPMILQPVDEHVRAIPLGKVMTAEDIYFSFPKSTTPAGWAAFGAKFPEEQRKAPHIVIWLDASGRFFCGNLFVCGDGRGVGVGPCGPGEEFHAYCCVLVRE